jgi:bifunctional NMN adenylyltransferase/nudix hydrolase
MKEKSKKYDIGVIIGRFQIHELHDSHEELINYVVERHKKVIIFLGVSPVLGTKRNPLDFPSRKRMIEEAYGDVITAVIPIRDVNNDYVWSKNVDSKIREVAPLGSVVMYGSRDSFIPHYHGQFDTCELEAAEKVSATQIRDEVSKQIDKSKEFRAGVIYGVYNTFPIVFPTVDVAIMNEDESQVLLGRKEHENKYRFIGGFVDVTDGSYEQAAKREAYEETGLEVGDLKYVRSMNIEDWRYSKEGDRTITTTLFKAKKIFGKEKANDDIVELRWFKLDDLNADNMVKEHLELLESLK